MAADTRPIDPLGRPDIVYDRGHGLGTLTRRFKVKGKYTKASELPGNIKRAFEAADFEHTDFLLAAQTIDGTEAQDGETSILVETYIQVPSDAATEVQIGGNVVTYLENNLKVVEQRKFVKRTHTLAGTVGTTTGETDSEAAGYDADTAGLILSQNRFAERGKVSAVVVKSWAEPGVLKQTEDYVGSQKAITIQATGVTPTKPNDYELAKTSVGNYKGFKTNDYTYLKPNVVLNESEDKVGSQNAIVKEVFKPSDQTNGPKPSSHDVAKVSASDVGGIPTIRFTYLKSNVVLNESEDKVGSQNAIVKEVFKPSDQTNGPKPSNHDVAKVSASDVGGIPTVRFTYLKPSVLSRNIRERNNRKLIIETVEAFKSEPSAETAGAVKIGDMESDVEGIPTRRYTFAKGEGQIRVSRRPGPTNMPGSKQVTVTSLGTKVTPPGAIIGDDESEEDGYIRYVVTALQGTLEGVKASYYDVVNVTVPGTVKPTVVSKSAGGIAGTIAVADVKGKRRKSLPAKVTIEIATAPPAGPYTPAYDLGDIACSIKQIAMSENFRGYQLFKTRSGNTRSHRNKKSANMSARIGNYPGCYLVGAGSSAGVFSYTSAYENTSNSPNSLLIEGLTSTSRTFIDGHGSSNPEGYKTTGILKRRARPIRTTLDGVTYWEIITWEAV